MPGSPLVMVLITSVSGSMVAQQVRSVPTLSVDQADCCGVQVTDAESQTRPVLRCLGGRGTPALPTQGNCFTVRLGKHSQNSGIDSIRRRNLASLI